MIAKKNHKKRTEKKRCLQNLKAWKPVNKTFKVNKSMKCFVSTYQEFSGVALSLYMRNA